MRRSDAKTLSVASLYTLFPALRGKGVHAIARREEASSDVDPGDFNLPMIRSGITPIGTTE